MTPRSLPSLASSEHQGALFWKAWDWQESNGCSTQRQNTEHGRRTSPWVLHNVRLWSPFKCFTSRLCATCSDTSCILTRGIFCQERDITCPEYLPPNQPSSVASWICFKSMRTPKPTHHCECRVNKDAFSGHR